MGSHTSSEVSVTVILNKHLTNYSESPPYTTAVTAEYEDG